ncbi:hypothetical protein [Streptococcus sp.]|jgi:hypothetical protein|uniref:hypothetical protein n=1 Tax=Streptococcus sp. TaxID=1306 RepID=UPI003919F8C4
MKKVMLSGLTLLSVLTLAACSTGNKETKTSESKEKTTQTTVEVTETTEVQEIKASGVTYLTDAEIEGIQTAGDYKRLFKSLMDTYVKDFDSLIAQLPKVAQNTIAPQRDQMVTTIEQQYKALEDQFAAVGATDDTPIPAESRDTLISTLKSSRDMLKSTMESIYKQAQDLLNQ